MPGALLAVLSAVSSGAKFHVDTCQHPDKPELKGVYIPALKLFVGLTDSFVSSVAVMVKVSDGKIHWPSPSPNKCEIRKIMVDIAISV